MSRWGLRLVVLCVLCTTIAHADNSEESAKTLFDSGRKAREEKNFTVACALFEKSYQLDPAAGTRLNIAECREHDKKWRQAWLLWISSAEDFEKFDDSTNRARAKFAREQAEKLTDKLGTVVIHIARPIRGMTLMVNARKIDPATTVIELVDGGSTTVRIEAPGRETFESTVDAEVGKRVTVEVPKLRRMQGPATSDDDEPSPSGPRTKLWAGLAIAGGVIAIGTFAYSMHLRGRITEIQNCFVPQACGYASDVERDEDGEHTASLANTTLILSGVAVVVAGVFVVKAVTSRRPSKSTAMIVPVISPTTAAASLHLRF